MRRLRSIVLLRASRSSAAAKRLYWIPPAIVAIQQRDALLDSVWLMLLVIVPVDGADSAFCLALPQVQYIRPLRAGLGSFDAARTGHLGGSLLIIIALVAITWTGTHLLDPLPADRSHRRGAGRYLRMRSRLKSMWWRWIGNGSSSTRNIASRHLIRLVPPIDRQVEFRITSSSVMNAFYIPAMAGMIYAMPGDGNAASRRDDPDRHLCGPFGELQR